MGAILATRDGGTIYFFSMATSFTKAALGAEGISRDVSMLVGNGYCPGHAEATLRLLARGAGAATRSSWSGTGERARPRYIVGQVLAIEKLRIRMS